MLNEIRRLMDQGLFVPFILHMTNGRSLLAPSVDPIAPAPMGGRVVVFENDGTANVLSALHTTQLSRVGLVNSDPGTAISVTAHLTINKFFGS